MLACHSGRRRDRLGDQFIARAEVPIEPPVGQAGGFHEIRDAHAIDPGFSEARGGYLHDAVVAFSLVRLGMAHQ